MSRISAYSHVKIVNIPLIQIFSIIQLCYKKMFCISNINLGKIYSLWSHKKYKIIINLENLYRIKILSNINQLYFYKKFFTSLLYFSVTINPNNSIIH